MAFSQQTDRVPTTIGNINVILFDTTDDGQGNPNQTARITIDVLDQNDEPIKRINANLIPHITAPQIAALTGFINDIRDQAELEVLPPAP